MNPTMNDYKQLKVLFYDYGLFVSLAERCTQFFGKVGYFAPWETSFADGREAILGFGVPGIERVKYFDQVVDDYDLIVFPDCLDGWLVNFLRRSTNPVTKQPYRVWGSGLGAELELARWRTKQRLKAAGLPIGEVYQVMGTKELRQFFRDKPTKDGWFVKVSGFRGLGETWHARDYVDAKGPIDEFEDERGGLSYITPFVIEACIPDAKEIGYDGMFMPEDRR